MYKNILIFKIILFALLIILINSNLKAEQYQLEIDGGYENAKDDSYKSSWYMLGAAIYLEPVYTDGKPLAEAAFLQKTSLFTFDLILAKSKSEDEYVKVDTDIYGIDASLKYVFPSIPLFVMLGYSHLKADLDATITFYPWELSATQNINGFAAGLGFYLTDTLAINGFCSKGSNKTDQSGITEEDITITYGGALKYLLLFRNGMAFNLQAAYNHESLKEEGDSKKYITREYELLGDLYLTPAFSVGGGIEINKGDIKSSVGKTYMVRIKLFVTQSIAISAQFQQFKVDDTSEGEDCRMFGVYITGRI